MWPPVSLRFGSTAFRSPSQHSRRPVQRLEATAQRTVDREPIRPISGRHRPNQPPTIIHHPNHPTTELNTNKIGRQAGVFCGVRCAPLHGSRPRKSELPRVEAPIEELGFLATVGQQIKGNQIESAQCIVGCVVEDGCRVEDGSLGFRWTWALDLPGRRSIVSLVR